MKRRAFATALGLVPVIASLPSAQSNYGVFRNGPGGSPNPHRVEEYYAGSVQYPNGASILPASGAPSLDSVSAVSQGEIGGGAAIDQVSGVLWSSDGTNIAVDNIPNYPAAPLPSPSATVLLPGTVSAGGIVGGIAYDSTGGSGLNMGGQVLFLADSNGFFRAFQPGVPPTPLGAAAPIPGLAPGPCAGLGYEPSTGTLWACDLGGGVYNFTPTGNPVTGGGSSFVGMAALPSPPAAGLAINTSNGPGAFPAPFFSGQTQGQFHVAVLDRGGNIVGFGGGGGTIASTAAPSGYDAIGLAFSSDLQTSLGSSGTSSPGMIPTITMNRPLTTGAVSPVTSLNFLGVPPGLAGGLSINLYPAPVGAGIPFGGGEIRIIDTITKATVVPITSGTPLAFPNALMLPGAQASMQAIYGFSAALPAGAVSEVTTFTAGLL